MSFSDDFFGEDDTEFLAAATQAEASQHARGGGFEASPRVAKRRRLDTRQGDGSTSPSSSAAPSSPPPPHHDSAPPTPDPDDEPQPESDAGGYFVGELAQAAAQQQAKESRHRIHVPEQGGQFAHQIFTQTQHGLDEDPGAFRGAVWKRPVEPVAVPVVARGGGVEGVGRGGVRGGGLGRGGMAPPPLPRAKGSIARSASGGLERYFTRPSQGGVDEGCEHDAVMAARLQAEENARGRPQSNGTGGPGSAPSTQFSQDVADELADLPSDAFSSSSSPEKSPGKEVFTISSSQPMPSQAQVRGLRGPQNGLKQMTIFGGAATQELSASQAAKKKHAWPLKAKEEPPTHHELDDEAMKTWVYPTNLGTIRDYQYNIVARSLYHNTLVALPTGLGKTFIAATIMLNYYRWTKDAQIVFMAPTKPLIAQQMEACYGIVGIAKRDTVLMTGDTQPGLRAEEWNERRVFFMTPQTVINDLKTGICDPKKIVLVVVDEAHKATGSYAYTEVIAFLRRFNRSFRVLALTATPGSSVETVQAVIDHLGIARVELRTEQSLDIRQYTHEKHTETELFDYSEEQELIMKHFSKALQPSLDKLNSQNAYWMRDPMQLSAYGLTTARGKWSSSEAGRKAPPAIKGMVQSIFGALSSLAHSIGILKNHGLGPFLSGLVKFTKDIESGHIKGKNPKQIEQSEDFVRAKSLITGWTNNPDFIGHPKLEYLREVLLNHFLDAGEGGQGPDVPPSATRVMVFTSFRDSTDEICRVLKRNEPMIRPHPFVGQAASKGSEGMDQRRQNAVIQDFKSGKYNTLVATSIGEEGLDIGTVDLIVCFDASSSPIRMLQRIGRTGRKRIGRVVLLLMKGKEENDYAKAQDNYSFIQKSIADASRYEYRDDQSPRILPKGTQPVVDKRMIEIPVENTQPLDLDERKRKGRGKGKVKRPPKKFHMPDGVKTGFAKASRMGMDGDESESEPAPQKKAPAKKKTVSGKTAPPSPPQPEPVQVPVLQDVLLTSVDRADLERRYMRVADDDENTIIRAPDVDRQPLRLGGSKYVRHGRAAIAVERALKSIGSIDNENVARMKKLRPDAQAMLEDAGEAGSRLVEVSKKRPADREEDLPRLPPGATKAVAKAAVKPASKPTNPRPKKASPKPAPAPPNRPSAPPRPAEPPSSPPPSPLSQNPPPRFQPAPNPPSRKSAPPPAKKRTKPSAATSTFLAAEAPSSSPQPTPANMRIGTQGIDLGSADTSGEDGEDDERDSELEEFVVGSDVTVPVGTSSQVGESSQMRGGSAGRGRGRGRLKRGVRLDGVVEVSSGGEDGDGGGDVVADGDNGGDESLDTEDDEKATAAAPVRQSRKRRVVGSSDSDE